VRQFLYCVAAAGLCGLLGSHGLAGGKASPPTGKLDLKKVADGETCGSYGTSVTFVATPSDAAKQADREQKLVFVLHVSGNFEDPTFT
jgi:hypothetical protein